ncbi:MAG: hypothetical protein JW774_06200 [Candidatus Aureabacteria bacterium]|nr:hypothetical protein [Candidatus Auribacterota bacterium]
MKKSVWYLFLMMLLVVPYFTAAEDVIKEEDPAESAQFEEGRDYPDPGHFNRREGKQLERKKMQNRWMEKEMPELANRLKKIRKEDPSVFRLFVRQRRENFHELMIGKKHGTDKETKQLIEAYLNNELDSLQKAKKYKETTNEKDQEKMEQDLKATLNTGFDLKEKLQSKMIDKMNKRIEHLRQMLEKRKELKERIISERFSELTQDEEQDIRW